MDFTEFIDRFPIQFNRQQQEAIRTVNGPVLLLAVPGSGKTTVLVARIGYMIHGCGIAPENILTLTYTVAATKDMAARFASFFGEELASRITFRTINSLCSQIIYYYSRIIGKKPFDLLADEKKKMGILSKIYQQVTHDFPTESELSHISTLITYIKNMMLTQDAITRLEEQPDSKDIRISQIFREYCRVLRKQSLMDFDDQMTYALTILRRSPEVLARFQHQYPYLCIDEAQDTSKIQHQIIALLASGKDNLFMVGDEDQSIYGFRAAYPEALLRFEEAHTNAKVLLMEENFRSNARIVAAADTFIQQNKLRHKKTMKPSRDAGSEVREIKLKSRGAQYSYLAKVADGCQTETVVLYRNNESAVPLVDLLERQQIPYRIRNAELGFFTHRIVRDIISIIRLALDPTDTESFLQTYFKINLYLTKEQAIWISEQSAAEHRSVFDVAIDGGGLSAHVLRNVKSIRTHLRNMRDERGDKAISRILKYMGYGDYLTRNGYGNQKIYLLRTIAAREETLAGFLDRMDYLYNIFKNKTFDPACPFILSTIHASKGLEYDTVYLLDVADGIFPESLPENISRMTDVKQKCSSTNLSRMTATEQSLFEEERRIFYVAATRAKNRLSVFSFNQESILTSGFFPHSKSNSSARTKQASSASKRKPAHDFYRQTPSKTTASSTDYHAFLEQLGAGILVTHKAFGPGAVISLQDPFIRISFEDQERSLHLPTLYAKGLLTIQ